MAVRNLDITAGQGHFIHFPPNVSDPAKNIAIIAGPSIFAQFSGG
jgi:hypothetical protein